MTRTSFHRGQSRNSATQTARSSGVSLGFPRSCRTLSGWAGESQEGKSPAISRRTDCENAQLSSSQPEQRRELGRASLLLRIPAQGDPAVEVLADQDHASPSPLERGSENLEVVRPVHQIGGARCRLQSPAGVAWYQDGLRPRGPRVRVFAPLGSTTHRRLCPSRRGAQPPSGSPSTHRTYASMSNLRSSPSALM